MTAALLSAAFALLESLPKYRAARHLFRNRRELELYEMTFIKWQVWNAQVGIALANATMYGHAVAQAPTCNRALRQAFAAHMEWLANEVRQDPMVAQVDIGHDRFETIIMRAEALGGLRISMQVRRLWNGRKSLSTSVTTTAAIIAGRGRAHLQEAWLADLAGAPEEGVILSGRERGRLACGFLWAAIRLRAHDVCVPLWRPVDWLLATSTRASAFVAVAVGAAVVYFDATEGLYVTAVERSEPCALLGTGLYALFRWLRRRRGIELVERHVKRE